MTEDSKLAYEIWDLFGDMLPANRRLEAATAMLRIFEEQLASNSRSLGDLLEEKDPYLVRAYYEVFPEEENEDDYDDEQDED